MDRQEPTDLLLTPAACYPLYPVIAARGMLPSGGGLYDMHSWCFRREPSRDPTRMQTFPRARVRAHGPGRVQVLKATAWFKRAQDFINELPCLYVIDVAHDPFFGRAGLLADSQREQKLKYELLVLINSEQTDGVRQLQLPDAFQRGLGYPGRMTAARSL